MQPWPIAFRQVHGGFVALSAVSARCPEPRSFPSCGEATQTVALVWLHCRREVSEMKKYVKPVVKKVSFSVVLSVTP